MDEEVKERLAKIISNRGICSRRDAEKLILAGKVKVKGQLWTSLSEKVSPRTPLEVSGESIPAPDHSFNPRLWLYHKPLGLICSHKDPEGRPSVFSSISTLHPHLPRLISVGRLDLNTEGLLLLTNKGSLARKLELPSTAWKRKYRVRVFGTLTATAQRQIQKGISINGIHYRPIECRTYPSEGRNQWIDLTLQEGKNREIRNIMEHFNLPINRLIRTAYGPFQLGNLLKNHIKEVSHKVIDEQIGNLCE